MIDLLHVQNLIIQAIMKKYVSIIIIIAMKLVLAYLHMSIVHKKLLMIGIYHNVIIIILHIAQCGLKLRQ